MNAYFREPMLSAADWRVVEIARKDGPRSINPDSFWTKVSRDLFGLPVARRLADKKLESLRRFSVRAWYWDLIRIADLRLMMEAGYSSASVFQILSHIAGRRGFTPSIQEQPN